MIDVAADAMPAGRVLSGRYEIVGPITVGPAPGHVYLGRDMARTGHPRVVVKHLDPVSTLSDFRRESFEHEVEVSRSLDNTGIPRLLDDIKDGIDRCAVFEHFEGIDLERQGKPMSPDNAVKLMRQACGILTYIHGMGIVHDDISTSNLLVALDGTLKLIDFGIARRLNLPRERGLLEAQRRHKAVGTLSYMSPEQIAGKDMDARSDLYSLAVVIYELLTGRRLFDARRMRVKRWRVARGGIGRKALRSLPANAETRQLLAKALERNPRKRFQSAGELMNALPSLP
ncbi:MAG: serine/threonine-protein kinase [candidate division WOR-3 bacterium]|nr:serine/threonine-protein kinase [candidate division WOR-3 bacterium]